MTGPLRRLTRLAVLGAGPAGLEAARLLTALGGDVTVYEAGSTVGAGLGRFPHVRLFTPWSDCVAEGALDDLRAHGLAVPDHDPDVCPTVTELLDGYLGAIARLPRLQDHIRLGHRVVKIGRAQALRFDVPRRGESPFRLLLEDPRGRERVVHADVVIDATGITTAPAWVGRGGIPAPGELDLRRRERIVGHLPAILGAARARYAGRRVLVVGSGCSAATAIIDLAALRAEAPATRVDWVVRHDGRQPVRPVMDDPLPGRAALIEAANAQVGLAARLHRGTWVERLVEARDGVIEVHLSSGERLVVDEVLGLVGYLPDFAMIDTLQLELDHVTRGPRRLAELLRRGDRARAPAHGALHRDHVGPEVLVGPEPDLYVIGHRSFGSRADYFLQAGYLQARLLTRILVRLPRSP